MNAPVFKLFSNCVPVKGARRSLLCDLYTGRTKLIPNSLFDLLTDYKDRSPEDIKAAHNGRYDEEIDEYYTFLVEHGWGFMCDDPDAFPEISLEYRIPELITNAVIDTDAGSQHDYAALMDQLEELGCKHIQYRFYNPRPLTEIEHLCALTEGRRLQGIEIYVPYGPDYADEGVLRDLCDRYQRIICLVLTGAPEHRMIHTAEPLMTMGVLHYHPSIIDSDRCCGLVDRSLFTVSMTAFTEALHFNSCLNRKISVDTRGNIKNCPSLEKTYGNTADTALKDAMEAEGFQDVWAVTKDAVSVCKDCEFRYICTDCRAFTENADPLGKPLSCGYDPYTAAWSETRFPPFTMEV
ncbi:MAG: grasp-with-spasm system SPASM domain peptide maturase [Acidobacteriota bacterium]|nr:grasp-with-spasm system SPASM domain peptide maturase [Acidobacteriota bacterium]